MSSQKQAKLRKGLVTEYLYRMCQALYKELGI